jgi:flagellar biosynthesis protein FlhF
MKKLDRDIVSELKQIEARLKELLDGLGGPAEGWSKDSPPVNKDILDAGFDPAMIEGKVPVSLLRSESASDQIVRALVGGVPVASTDDRILVFLGPSGSGKTTTLLKVARTVFIPNGAKPKVVFFGSYDEDTSWLKARCRSLGLKFTRISRIDKMAKLIKKEKAPVLVDTPSISDLGDAELRFLVEAGKLTPGMGLRLVVEATMDPWNVCAIASCIPQTPEMSLVLTKLDEATRIGGAVSASIASGIPVALVTGGREVSDGVHVPDVETLSEKIMDGVRSVSPQRDTWRA